MLLAGTIALLGYASAGSRALSGDQVFDAPRENVGWLLAGRIADGKGASLPLLHHDRLPPAIAQALTPRDAASRDGAVLPQDFAGSILLFALLRWLWDPLALALVPILAVASAFLLAQVTVELYAPGGRWHTPPSRAAAITSALAFVVWLAHPGLIVTGSMVFDSAVPTLVALLSAALFFIRFWRNGETIHLVLLALALGASIALRYPSIFFALPLAFALLLARKVSLRQALVALAVLLPFAGLILGFNQAVYGSPTTTGYHLSTDLLGATADTESGILSFDPAAFGRHLWFYGVLQPTVLLPAIIGLAVGWRFRRQQDGPWLVRSLIAACLVLLATHAGLKTWGSTQTAINASFVRYTLPAVAIGLALLAWSLRSAAANRPRLLVASAGLLAAVSAWTAVAGPVALNIRHTEVETGRWVREAATRHTPADALVASAVSDRAVFPHRQTLTLPLLARPGATVEPEAQRSRWDVLPSPGRFAAAADQVIGAGIPLFLLYDFKLPLEPYADSLRARGLRLERTVDGGPRYPTLYRITAAA